MKRSFVVACVLALTLALGLSVSASAGTGAGVSAEVSAKPAKKGKSCKGKAGKQKAGKSAAATAQAKKKGKSKSCKSKGKGGDKGTPAPAAAPFSDGTYGDPTTFVELSVSNGATTAVLKYTPPGGCVTISYTSQPVTLTKSGDTWTASETRAFSLVGEPANVKWDLTIKEPGLTYALNFTMDSNTMIGLCKWEGHPAGTLAKVG